MNMILNDTHKARIMAAASNVADEIASKAADEALVAII